MVDTVWAGNDSTNMILEAEAPLAMLAAHPAGTEAAAIFLRSIVEDANPSYAHVAQGGYGLWQTPLEASLRIYANKTVPHARQTLRGYSWITVLSQEIGDRLGGLPRLARSSAFCDVSQLAGGGYWLRATPTFDEFDNFAAEAVYQEVKDVLLPGTPIERDPRDAPRILALRPGGSFAA